VRFTPSAVSGVVIVDVEPRADERGAFSRTWCADEFEAAGLPGRLAQTSVSVTARRGTLRGLHFQRPPSREGKLVRCTRGRIHDVVVDLRPDSPTFLRHVALELDDRAHRAVYVPPGCAHGFQTLVDDAEVLYAMTDRHAPELADGVRWDDPAFAIRWPERPTLIHPRDAAYPDFDAGRAWAAA
jgi:dTDP-4-dehydrorhamnose 3,5-epimerase